MFFWFVSLSGFIILYAPFIATRHILLVLPALLFFLAPIIEKATVRIQLLTVLVTGFLGLTLGVSDWITANYYRKVSQELHITGTDTTRIWTAGHWGWQWYAGLTGMNQYDTLTSKVREGDLLIFPANIPRQKIDDDIVLKEVWKTWDKPSVFTYFSTGPKGGFYFSSYKRPGWRLLNEPVDTILVYRITGTKSGD
jgi:hypothetical protein